MTLTRTSAFLMAALSLAGTAGATTAQTASPLQLRFEENRGQAATEVRYVARGRGQTMLFSDAGVRIQWPGRDGGAAGVRLMFPGSSGPAGWEPAGPVGFVSYFLGADASQWVRGAPRFEKLARRNLYPGVDAVFYGQDNRLEYDLVLAPGTDPGVVRVRFEGADRLRMDEDGAIEITTASGTLRQRTPLIYQESGGARVPVKGRFVRAGANEFRLELGAYDPALALTVDPVLESATYLGGENDDQVTFVSGDFVAGNTSSVAFYGAVPQARRSRDIFISYRSRQYSFPLLTIIGGSGNDELAGVGTDGRDYTVAGTTTSLDFPGGFGREYRGGKSDGFFLRLQPTSQYGDLNLLGTVFVGGTGEDRIQSMAYSSGTAYLAGVTDSPDLPVQRAFQSSPGGGKDAFVVVSSFLSISLLSYLGGSGDDEATSVAICARQICMGGETRSPDFPLEGPGRRELQGASDAFVATIDPTPRGAARLVASLLVGGSGEDRINALAGTTQPIAATGTTTSGDFPTVNPVQARFGGESDAFILTLNSEDGVVAFSSWLGGSGTDRGLGLAVSPYGELFVAGSTQSADLPVVDAFQPAPGGGEDAFYAVIGSDRLFKQLTYYGGSGDDRINSIGLSYQQPILGGQTTSDNLPLRNPSQDRKDGGIDGFTAVIGTAYITGPDQLAIGKGLATQVSLSSGQSNAPPITLRISDPSKLQILTGSGAVSEVTAASWQFSLQALADSGEVEITATAPGFGSKAIKARLYPSVAAHSLQPVTEMTTLSAPLRLTYQLSALDPETNRILSGGWLPEGVTAKAEWSASDASVLRIQGTETLMEAIPAGTGSAQLSLNVRGFPTWPPDPVTVNVRGARLAATSLAAAPDLRCPVSYSFAETSSAIRVLGRTSSITMRSMDPSRLLLSTRVDEAGQESVTVPIGVLGVYPAVYAEALATSGQVGLLITSPDAEAPLEAVVPLSSATVQLNIGGFSLTAGGGIGVVLRLAPAENAGMSCSARPGLEPFEVQLISSDPSVAAFHPSTVNFSAPNIIAANLRAVAPGTVTVSTQPQSPHFRASEPVPVTVVKSVSVPAEIPTVPVGKDLQTTVQVTPQGVTGAVEAVISVDDPSLALVAPDSSSTGAAEIRMRFQGSTRFQVQGLQAQGQTNVRVRVPGAVEIVHVITLGPSGFAFNQDSFRQTLTTSVGEALLGSYLLDDVTGSPLVAQFLRPGVSAHVTVRKEQGDAVTLTTSTLSFPGPMQGAQRVLWTAQSTGEATLGFDQPQGFTTPSRRMQLRIRVSKSTFTLARAYAVAKDGVLEVNLQSVPVPSFSVTSGDPARVLVSAKPGDPGSVAVTITRGQAFYLHGMVDHGVVPLRVSAPAAEDAESTAVLSPMAVALSGLEADPVTAIAYGSAYSGTLGLIAQDGSAMRLRPGVSPVRIEIASSDSRVVSVTPEVLELRSGSAMTVESFAMNFEGAGEAEIRIRVPAGYIINRDRIPVSVRAPRLLLPENLALGKDLQRSVDLTAEQGMLKDNLIVTVSSLAPEKLLLSRSSTTTGSASLAVPYSVGMYSSQPFYLQALAGEGSAPLRITAPGYAESTVNVPLAPAAVGWFNLSKDAPVKLRSGEAMTLWGGFEAGGQAMPAAGLRPGVPDVRASVSVGDPSIATLTADAFTFRTGDSQQTLTLRGIAKGATTIELAVPPGFVAPSLAPQTVRVEVAGRLFSSGCPSGGTRTGKNTQTECRISVQPGVAVKAVSSDPTRLLVSFEAGMVGSGQASLTPQSGEFRLYLQALAAEGSVRVTLSAPGYEDLIIPVELARAVFILQNATQTSAPVPLQVGSSRDLTVEIRLLDSQGAANGYGLLSPGASPLRIELTSSDPSVATLSATSLTFEAGDGAKTVQLNGVKAGSTVIRVATPGGFTPPPRDAVLFTVVP